jgi:SOS-response transcriptional repressor LexA
MGWADFAREALRRGETVQIRPRGHSMKGKVNDGDLVTLQPCVPEELAVGEIVLVRVRGTDYLHLIKAIDSGRFLIGNNRGGTNGWVGANALLGKATKIENG